MSTGTLKVKLFEASGANVIPLSKSTATIGSDVRCDVVLGHPSISAEHARAWLEGGRLWIQDLGSESGTFINGIRLPALKPMLVRDLDVLKLGENPATLGLEANLVRAPVVKAVAAPVAEEVTVTDFKPPAEKDQELERRREELAQVSRELAELKLQLQMSRLEKDSDGEMRQQISALREELRGLSEQRESLLEKLRKLDSSRQTRAQELDREIAVKREKLEAELREMRDTQSRKTTHWKVDMVAELNNQVHALTQRKSAQWTAHPMNHNLIFELEADLNLLFRKILLEEEVKGIPAASASAAPTVITHIPAVVTSVTGTVSSTREKSRSTTRAKTKTRVVSRPDRRVLLAGAGGFALILLIAVGWIATRSSKTPNSRDVASVSTFAPALTQTFKKTYTDNVLYTTHYATTEFDPKVRKMWMADLALAGRQKWHMKDEAITALMSQEQQMIRDLQGLRQTVDPTHPQIAISRMRARENQFLNSLPSLIHQPHAADQFLSVKRAFFARHPMARH